MDMGLDNLQFCTMPRVWTFKPDMDYTVSPKRKAPFCGSPMSLDNGVPRFFIEEKPVKVKRKPVKVRRKPVKASRKPVKLVRVGWNSLMEGTIMELLWVIASVADDKRVVPS